MSNASTLAKEPAWRRIATALEDDIAAGRYAANARLPTVMRLAEDFGVNRHTVRQALGYLQQKGTVSVEQGRGTFVVDRTFDYRIGRRVRMTAGLSGDRMAFGGEILSAEIKAATAAQAQRLKISENDPIWVLKTIRSAEHHVIGVSTMELSADRFPDYPDRLAAAEISPTRAFRSYGIDDYIRRETRIEAGLADAETEKLLSLPPGLPVLITHGFDTLPDGTPLQTVVTHFAGHRVQLVVGADDL